MKIGASYSTVSEAELLAKLVPQFETTTPKSCRFWQRGINDTYQVHCEDHAYSLRVYRHELRTRDAVDFEVAALNHLDARGAPVAAPVPLRDGGYVAELQAPEGIRYAIMTSHAPGSEPDYDDLDNGRLFGASVAELHTLSENFETHHQRPRLDVETLLDKSIDIIAAHCLHRPDDLKFLHDTAATLREAVAAQSLHGLDTGFCHGDCHGGNVHLHNGVLTHFDFDCCGFGYRVFELATFKWGINGDDNEKELWAAFLEGYRAARDISTADLSVIDAFVVIRHIWWMALIMGNASDFGYSATSDEFITHHIRRARRLLNVYTM